MEEPKDIFVTEPVPSETTPQATTNAALHSNKKPFSIIAIVLLLLIIVGAFAYDIFIQKQILPINHSVPEVSTQKPEEKDSQANANITPFEIPKPPYSIMFSGRISQDHKQVDIEPLIFTSDKISELEKAGTSNPDEQFGVVLRKQGNSFYQQTFKASECVDWSPGDYCGKTDPSYGDFLFNLSKIEQYPDEIVIQYRGQEIYKLTPPNAPEPTLKLTNQVYAGGQININWSVKDPAQKLSYRGYVSNNNFIQNNKGQNLTLAYSQFDADLKGKSIFTTNSFNFTTEGVIEGDVQVAIYASDGFRTYVAYSEIFKTGRGNVKAIIKMPIEGERYGQNNVQLEANSFDPRTGMRCSGCKEEGNTFTWTSDVDGVISNLHDTYCQFLTPGRHTITLNVKNENGTEDSTSVNIEVLPIDMSQAAQDETIARQKKGETCYY